MRRLKLAGLIVLASLAVLLALTFVAIGILVAYAISTGATWPFVYGHSMSPG